MPLLIIAAAAVLVAPVPSPPSRACAPPSRQAAAASALATPHILANEPGAERMHAVLRRVGGCVVVDVNTVRSGVQSWEYQPIGPDRIGPRPADGDAR